MRDVIKVFKALSDVNRIRVMLYNKPEGEICTQKDEECWAKNRRDNFVVN